MEIPELTIFFQEDETDYIDARRSRHRFEEDLEAEARAEKRIMNAKKVCYLVNEILLIDFS